MNPHAKAAAAIHQYVHVITNVSQSRAGFKSDFVVRPDTSFGLLTYRGYLKAADPISGTIILCNIDNNTHQVTESILILKHVVQDIVVHQGDHVFEKSLVEEIVERERITALAKHPYFARPDVDHRLSDEKLKELQQGIMSWFKKYRIPISLDESSQELIIADWVRVKPPYSHESDYICPTRVILKRIKHMVDSRPKQCDTREC